MRHSFVPPADRPEDTLTPRQFEVSALIARGMSNKDIAKACCIAVATVKRHVQEAMEKTGCENRTALAVWFLTRFPTEKEAQAGYKRAVHTAYAAKFAVAQSFFAIRPSAAS